MKNERLEILQKVANKELTPEQADERLLSLFIKRSWEIGKKAKEIKEQEEQQEAILNSDAFFCYTCSALEEWDCVCEDELGFDESEIYHDYEKRNIHCNSL